MKAKEIDKKFDEGEDITKYLDITLWLELHFQPHLFNILENGELALFSAPKITSNY